MALRHPSWAVLQPGKRLPEITKRRAPGAQRVGGTSCGGSRLSTPRAGLTHHLEAWLFNRGAGNQCLGAGLEGVGPIHCG